MGLSGAGHSGRGYAPRVWYRQIQGNRAFPGDGRFGLSLRPRAVESLVGVFLRRELKDFQRTAVAGMIAGLRNWVFGVSGRVVVIVQSRDKRRRLIVRRVDKRDNT